jgi:hypothetical protein
MTRSIRQHLAALTLCLCTGSMAVASSGCRVTDADVRRWETTELGPSKLVAVVTHDKYEWPLRIDAAAALIRMKPRNGRRVGIGRLQEAVAMLPPEERTKLCAGLIPIIVGEMDKPPPESQGMAPGEAKADPSVPFKDAAYALLNYEKTVLVSDDAQRKTLQDALVRWAMNGFDRRISISNQLYGLEQIFRYLGAEGVRQLPALIKPGSAYDRVASLIAELGDQPTKEAASQKLVALAQDTESDAWVARMKPQVDQSNKAAGYTVDDAKLTRQVKDFQEEQIVKAFAALKKVGGRPAVDYLLGVGADKNKPEKRREAALAALENRLDRNNPGDVQRVLAIAGGEETPDSVRQQAFNRAAELPREQVAPKLYELFSQKDVKRWKIRWVAASTVLKMSKGPDVGEFLAKLPPGNAAGMTPAEPLEYGSLIGKMNPPPSKDVMVANLKSSQLATKLTALGYFYAYGRAGDVPTVQALEDEKTPLPKSEDPENKWQCPSPKAGGKPGEMEPKDVATVGEFAKLCVLPQMTSRK